MLLLLFGGSILWDALFLTVASRAPGVSYAARLPSVSGAARAPSIGFEVVE